MISTIVVGCNTKEETENENLVSDQLKINKEKQDAIIEAHLMKGAWNHPLYSSEWQTEIDKGLAKDSTIAYLWQQKAMPLFKQGKYEVGMPFIDKAVTYNRRRWQDYRAFIKCIFAKTYKEAIADFEAYKTLYGNSYVMDHSYDFYIGLSYLQLNEFSKAEAVFKRDYDAVVADKGEDWLHHLDLFYFGICKLELKKYKEAIVFFDMALAIYPTFSDVQYYKAICMNKINDDKEADALFAVAKENGKKGNTINEDNVIYERYPYQVRWR